MENDYSYIIDRDNIRWFREVIDIIEKHPDNAYVSIGVNKKNQNLIFFYQTIEWIPGVSMPLVSPRNNITIKKIECDCVTVSPNWISDRNPN